MTANLAIATLQGLSDHLLIMMSSDADKVTGNAVVSRMLLDCAVNSVKFVILTFLNTFLYWLVLINVRMDISTLLPEMVVNGMIFAHYDIA